MAAKPIGTNSRVREGSAKDLMLVTKEMEEGDMVDAMMCSHSGSKARASKVGSKAKGTWAMKVTGGEEIMRILKATGVKGTEMAKKASRAKIVVAQASMTKKERFNDEVEVTGAANDKVIEGTVNEIVAGGATSITGIRANSS
ncbi:hypothetical protein ACLOJK_003618 [Asimina triloba]